MFRFSSSPCWWRALCALLLNEKLRPAVTKRRRQQHSSILFLCSINSIDPIMKCCGQQAARLVYLIAVGPAQWTNKEWLHILLLFCSGCCRFTVANLLLTSRASCIGLYKKDLLHWGKKKWQLIRFNSSPEQQARPSGRKRPLIRHRLSRPIV